MAGGTRAAWGFAATGSSTTRKGGNLGERSGETRSVVEIPIRSARWMGLVTTVACSEVDQNAVLVICENESYRIVLSEA